jgi:hypothetical protein
MHISRMFRASASDWPRSRAETRIGARRRRRSMGTGSARHQAERLPYPSGFAMPVPVDVLLRIASLLCPRREPKRRASRGRPRPMSAKRRSPWSSMNCGAITR